MVALRTKVTDNNVRRLPTRAAKLTMTDGPVFVRMQAWASGLYFMEAKKDARCDFNIIGTGV